MYKKTARLLMVLGLASLVISPADARYYGGFHGGGFGGYHAGGFGGYHAGGFGGYHAGGYGGYHAGGYGGYHPYGGGFGGTVARPAFGGGFAGAGVARPVVSNHPYYGGGGINHNNFNNDTFNRNVNVNNINAYHGGYHPYGAYGGYHPYGGGYHPYGAYGYHPYGGYGYGYNPEAMMWTYAGVSSLTSLTTFLGMSMLSGGGGGNKQQQPASYSNVTYNGGNIYVDGQAAGNSSDFYKQAQQLAATAYNQGYTQGAANGSVTADNGTYTGTGNVEGQNGSPGEQQGGAPAQAPGGPWQTLGTFSLAPKGQSGQSQTGMMVQLEVNKDGILSGTYFNQLTMETSQIYGAVDKKTQRVSWTIGTNPNTVFDAGLGDLTKEESSVLVHYGPDNTQRMSLVRLKQPPPGMTAPGAQGDQGQAQGQGQPQTQYPSQYPGQN